MASSSHNVKVITLQKLISSAAGVFDTAEGNQVIRTRSFDGHCSVILTDQEMYIY